MRIHLTKTLKITTHSWIEPVINVLACMQYVLSVTLTIGKTVTIRFHVIRYHHRQTHIVNSAYTLAAMMHTLNTLRKSTTQSPVSQSYVHCRPNCVIMHVAVAELLCNFERVKLESTLSYDETSQNLRNRHRDHD